MRARNTRGSSRKNERGNGLVPGASRRSRTRNATTTIDGTDHHGPDEIQQVPDRGVAPLAPMQPEGDMDERPDRERQQRGGEVWQDRDREVGRIEADAEHDDGRSERGDDIEHEQQPARPVEPPARPEGGRTVRSAHLRPHPTSRLACFGRSREAWYFATVQNDEIARPRWPWLAGRSVVLPYCHASTDGPTARGIADGTMQRP